MKHRRGISEIVGAFVIITVITISAILYVNVAVRQAQIIETTLDQRTEQIAEQISPLGITPVVTSGSLSLVLAPTDPGERLHVIVFDLDNKQIINKTIIANSTQTTITVSNNYNCSRIKIVVIRESGAIIQYNSYNDPRAVTHYKDPTVFSCEILDPSIPPGSVKEPLYNKTITRVFDIRANDKINVIPVNYSLVIGVGGIANINVEPVCSLDISVNGSYVTKIKECSHDLKIANFTINNKTVDVYLKIRANKEVIVGYIDFKVNDPDNLYVFYLNTTYKMAINYAYVYQYNRYIGTLSDTIHPVPLAQAVSGSYSATWRLFKQQGFANYFLVVQGIGQSDVVTTGPMVLFMSTKKEKAGFSIKHEIYIEKVYYAPLIYKDYSIGVINMLTINTTSLIEASATDPFAMAALAMAAQLIDIGDWNIGTPDLIINGGQSYNLEPNTDYTVVCPQGCEAHVRFYGSAVRIPFITDVGYEETKILKAYGHILYINIGFDVGVPKPFVGAPLSISIDHDGMRELILTALDDPGTINVDAGQLYWVTPITAYAIAGTLIAADNMGADSVCLINLTGVARLPVKTNYSLIEPPAAACGEIVTTGPQTLYALVTMRDQGGQDILETVIYANYLYRILYSS